MDHLIDRFLNYLAVERGLSANTLAAYSSDLQEIKGFLNAKGIAHWDEMTRDHISAYIQALGGRLADRSKASTSGPDRTLGRVSPTFGKVILAAGFWRMAPST